jgi:enamine deaminase RidA (YjgF/YER057c/UK114 family)
MFRHLQSVIEAAGGLTDDIIKLTLWMVDRSKREAVNREWVAMFPNPETRPARQAVQAELGNGILVQCDFLAVIGER